MNDSCQSVIIALSMCLACGEDGRVNTVDSTSQTPVAPVLSTPTLPNEVTTAPDSAPLLGLEYDPVAKRFIIPETGPPPAKPFVANTKLAPDTTVREEQLGVILEAVIVHREVPAPMRSPEFNKAGHAAAVKAGESTFIVTMTALGRMRWLFTSRAQPLPFTSELRARFDRFGHLVVWPGLSKYRVLPPGSIRTTLAERRVDVMPLAAGIKTSNPNAKRLEIPTRAFSLESPFGTVSLEVASVPESGLGGPLFCRSLVELVGVDPATAECKPGEVPLYASIEWKNGGGFEIEISSVERRTDLLPTEVLVPPPNAELSDGELPSANDGVRFTKEALAAFRTKATEAPRTPDAPIEGLIADNRHDVPLVLLLDGVPIVSVPSQEKRLILGPLPGRYVIQWRSFLGDVVLPSEPAAVPAYFYSKAPPPPPPVPETPPDP